MATTPWGDSGTLRERKLQPARGVAPGEVERNQHERLFAAMIARVAEAGYSGTSVSDLLALSGVSSRSFYEYFPDKASCLRATIEAALEQLDAAGPPSDPGDDELEAWLSSLYSDFATIVAAQPAAAKVLLVDAFSDPAGREPIVAAIAAWETRIEGRYRAAAGRGAIPERLVAARLGGILEVARARLRKGRESELQKLGPALVELLLADAAPPAPLRLATRPPKGEPEGLSSADHAERAIRALSVLVVEQGYGATTVDDVLRKASMSATTFYANFEGKEDLMATAIDSACAQIVAAGATAFARHDDWPSAVRAGFGAMLNFLASRPALAHLIAVEVYTAGGDAINRRNNGLRPLGALIENNTMSYGQVQPIDYEAMAGAVYHLIHEEVQGSGTDSLPGLAPLCTYLTLAPFIGPDEAGEVANEAGGRSRRGGAPAIPLKRPMKGSFYLALGWLSERPRTPAEVADWIEEDIEVVRDYLDDLTELESVNVVGEKTVDGVREPLYRSDVDNPLNLMSSQQVEMMTPEELKALFGKGLKLVIEELQASMASGSFVARPDFAYIRSPMDLDELSWKELSKLHEATLLASLEIRARALKRLAESGATPIRARSLQFLFEMPPSDDA